MYVVYNWNAKKKADDACANAKDAKSANNRLDKLNEKIKQINAGIKKKKERLKELDQMLADIRAQHPAK
jgi:prefoldin subunit 5